MKYNLLTIGIIALSLFACATPPADRSESARNEPTAPREVVLDSLATLDFDSLGLVSEIPSHLTEARTGEIVLFDGQQQRITVVDSTGKLLQAFGSGGQGPGQFLNAESVFSLPGDTLMIFDRQRQVGYLYHQFQLTEDRLDFRDWGFSSGTDLRMVGRLGDGSWVALQRAQLYFTLLGARAIEDTVRLLAGTPGAPPRELALAGIRRFVDVGTTAISSRVQLDDLSPASGMICEQGLVLADSAGVRYLRADGTLASQHTHPFRRIPIERLGGAEGIVQRVTSSSFDVKGPAMEAARRILRGWAESVDSAMNPIHLDGRGSVWYSIPVDPSAGAEGLAYARVTGGSVDSLQLRAPALTKVGKRYLVSMMFDKERETFVYRLLRIPQSDVTGDVQLGWCYNPFPW
ncbi:MAG: hypothetical protein K2Y26_07190 [Gemmatimonadaceae bacterium]|nr:hypothetical protein [Gemmatimonadaceae bacterium]